MHSKAINKINKMGKAGHIITSVLIVAAVIYTVILGAATVYINTNERSTSNVSVMGNKVVISSQSNFLERVVYHCVADNSSGKLVFSDSKINVKVDTKDPLLKGTIIQMSGESGNNNSSFTKDKINAVLISSIFFSATVIIALIAINSLLRYISHCETPFCTAAVKKAALFVASLVPVAIASSVVGTVTASALNPAGGVAIYVNKTLFAIIIVLFAGLYIIKYGVKLQTESDETL